jgi:hypothetical protein
MLTHCSWLQSCQQHTLHPFNEAAAQQHAASCVKLAASIARRKRDGAIECGICYEKVSCAAWWATSTADDLAIIQQQTCCLQDHGGVELWSSCLRLVLSQHCSKVLQPSEFGTAHIVWWHHGCLFGGLPHQSRACRAAHGNNIMHSVLPPSAVALLPCLLSGAGQGGDGCAPLWADGV